MAFGTDIMTDEDLNSQSKIIPSSAYPDFDITVIS